MATPIRIRKPMPTRGLVTALPADSIGPEAASNCYNVRFKFGQVTHGPGRARLAVPPIAEIVRNMGYVTNTTGVQVPYMLTDSQLWGNVSDDSALPMPPWSAIAVGGAPLSFSVNTRFGVTSGEGFMFFSRCQKTDNILFTSDDIAKWDMTLTTPGWEYLSSLGTYEYTVGSFSSVAGRFLEYMNGHLVAFNVVEEDPSTGRGHVLPQRIRWSESGNHMHWDDSKGLGAGFFDLWEGDASPIMGVARLRDDAVIVRAESIGHFTPTFQLQPEFSYKTRIRGFGTRAPYSVASNGSMVFFLGTDNIVYSWDGANLAPIGGAIQNYIAGITKILMTNNYTPYEEQTGIIGMCSPQRGEYWLILRRNDSGANTTVLVWDWVRQCWTQDSYPNITCLGSFNLATNYVSYIPGWFGGGDDGRNFAIDENFPADAYSSDLTIDRFMETEDIYFDIGSGADPWNLGTVIRMLLVYDDIAEIPLEVGISTNRGNTYQTKLVTPNPSGYSIIDMGPITGNVVRFRFRMKDVNAAFRWTSYSAQFLPAGEYIGTTT